MQPPKGIFKHLYLHTRPTLSQLADELSKMTFQCVLSKQFMSSQAQHSCAAAMGNPVARLKNFRRSRQYEKDIDSRRKLALA
jgi:hypothetical protein